MVIMATPGIRAIQSRSYKYPEILQTQDFRAIKKQVEEKHVVMKGMEA